MEHADESCIPGKFSGFDDVVLFCLQPIGRKSHTQDHQQKDKREYRTTERKLLFGQGSGSAGAGANNKDRMCSQGGRQVTGFHGFGF